LKLRQIDPLFQFLGTGALLVALSAVVRPFGSGEDSIRVDRAALEQYIASGGGEALAALARSTGGTPDLDALTAAQRRELADKYVEEQALYREARAWGLDESDLVIRRRLGQSMRFALRPAPKADPGDEVLRAFYLGHKGSYRSPAETSFDHIYFSSDVRGSADALNAARRFASSAIGDWRATGDRFAYQRSYVDAPPGMIESQLGKTFVAALARLPVDRSRWQGPVPSATGYHLVRINRRQDAALPPFEAVRAAVLVDWQRQSQDDELDGAVADIVRKYRVDMTRDVQ